MGHSRNIKGKAKKLEPFFENHLALVSIHRCWEGVGSQASKVSCALVLLRGADVPRKAKGGETTSFSMSKASVS